MGKVTLYLDSRTERRMKAAAKAAGTSPSQWAATLIWEKTATVWPSTIARLAGAWGNDFPTLEEIRSEAKSEASREHL